MQSREKGEFCRPEEQGSCSHACWVGPPGEQQCSSHTQSAWRSSLRFASSAFQPGGNQTPGKPRERNGMLCSNTSFLKELLFVVWKASPSEVKSCFKQKVLLFLNDFSLTRVKPSQMSQFPSNPHVPKSHNSSVMTYETTPANLQTQSVPPKPPQGLERSVYFHTNQGEIHVFVNSQKPVHFYYVFSGFPLIYKGDSLYQHTCTFQFLFLLKLAVSPTRFWDSTAS